MGDSTLKRLDYIFNCVINVCRRLNHYLVLWQNPVAISRGVQKTIVGPSRQLQVLLSFFSCFKILGLLRGELSSSTSHSARFFFCVFLLASWFPLSSLLECWLRGALESLQNRALARSCPSKLSAGSAL